MSLTSIIVKMSCDNVMHYKALMFLCSLSKCFRSNGKLQRIAAKIAAKEKLTDGENLIYNSNNFVVIKTELRGIAAKNKREGLTQDEQAHMDKHSTGDLLLLVWQSDLATCL